MIQANELRIGNYLKTPEGAFMTVKTLKQDDDDILVNERNGMFTLNYTAFPIPLTEEILLRSGFTKEKNVIPIYTLGDISIYLECSLYPRGRVYFNSWAILKHRPKSLHKLQNLFSALTDKELNIEL